MEKYDARTTLISTFFIILSLIIMKNVFQMMICLFFLTVQLYTFKINIHDLRRVMKYSIGLFFSIVFINYFFMNKSIFFIVISLFRVIGIIFLFVSIISSLEIMDIAIALEKILSPLNKIKIPVSTLSTIFATSLKFIPLIKEEGDRILMAQKARGIDISVMNFSEKIRNIITLFFPVIISGIQHSINLAVAMEVRGFGYKGIKTRFNESIMTNKDYKYLIFSFIIFLIVILFK